MATTFEKTWQFSTNQAMDLTSTTVTWHNEAWWMKAFICGQLATSVYSALSGAALTSYQGLWTVYYSCDATNVGTAGDGIDRWGSVGSTTGTSGSAASLVTGATVTGAIRITGVTGLGSSLGNFLTITGAATAANNSPTNTPYKIVKVNSATDVEIYNPNGVVSDANNGAISWTERNNFTFDNTKITGAATAHSWMVLKSPAALGPYYLIIDLNVATVGTIGVVVVAKTAPTGGTTSARPTSTDEVTISTTSFFTTGTGRMHGGIATDGNFHILSSADGSGWVGFLMFQVLADTKSNDLYKALLYCRGGGSGNNLASFTGLQAQTTSSVRHFNGSVVLAPTALYMSGTAVNNQFFNSFLTTADYVDSSYPDWPIYWLVTTVGYQSLKGRWVDYRWCPFSMLDGTAESNQSTPTSVVVNDIWVPYNAVPTI